ncbi:MAG: hypothetical protein IKU15_04455 [Clostridia bacterium]|nr:hypothetical protein [Clostridia bacterium]
MSDLKDLMNSLSNEEIIDIMTKLGADRFEETGNAIIFPTICHNHDAAEASMKLYYYPKTHTFHCYTDCSCTFNVIEMFKKRYELLNVQYDFFKDIVLKIGGKAGPKQRETFYQPYQSIYTKENHNAEVNLPILNKGLLNAYTFYPTAEWLEDGISEEVMKIYNILYSISENKIIIPHYDVEGNLIGIRGRSLNDEDIALGKYRPVTIEGKMYNHPLQFNLYGLNFVRENIKKYKVAIVAESEKSCLQYATMFGQDRNIVVAACGSAFHKYQLDLLLQCGAEKVLIAFDKEGETWAEQEKYFAKLKAICEKYKNYCTMGFVYDNSNLLKLKQSPFDCGPEVATKLISKGVWL